MIQLLGDPLLASGADAVSPKEPAVRSLRQHVSVRRIVALMVALVISLSWIGALPTQNASAAEVGPNRVYFSQTGHYLSNGFLSYWRTHGGINVLGYPLTEEFQQNGVTVQYFERAIFEYHPNNTPDWRVELRRLGADQAQGINDPAFNPVKSQSDSSCTFYPETNHRLCNGFQDYWKNNGGLSVFGYPLSEEFSQKNPDTGQVYTVQYFERARFEWHLNSQGTVGTVMLGRLGAEAAKADGVDTSNVKNSANAPEYSANLWYNPNTPPTQVTSPPPGAPSNQAKWIEVDLTHQYMRAWEYNHLFYGEYISSGVSDHLTPTGTFHIFEKLRYDEMIGGTKGTPDYYDLKNVPWVMYFLQGGYALHGTYWHHNFGYPMSHGCVNMTIDGAATVYAWAPIGTTVWIHY